MMDLASSIENRADIILDPATNDLKVEFNPILVVISELIEMFDMVSGDDIDYPEIYSKQRKAMNSTEFADQAFRIRDAERVLRLHPMIKNDTIEVSLNREDQLMISFKLTTGEEMKSFVMR
jgi:hypothetical protein